MKIIYKNMGGKLLKMMQNLHNLEYNEKHLYLGEVIPTVRISKSFIANSISSEIDDIVVDEILSSILNNKNGVRAIINGNPVQMRMRKFIFEDIHTEFKSVMFLVNITDSDSVIVLYDDVENKCFKDRNIDLDKESSKFIDLVEIIKEGNKVEEINKEKEEIKEDIYPVNSDMSISMLIGAHTGILWKSIENSIPKQELVEVEDGEYAIDYIRYEMIKQNKLKGFMIPYLCRMDNFIFSNLTDTEEHMKLIPKIWNIIHSEIPLYHKDKKENKDFTFTAKITNRIESFIKEEYGVELKKEEEIKKDDNDKQATKVEEPKPNEDKLVEETNVEVKEEVKTDESIKVEFEVKEAHQPTKEEQEEFDKDLAEVDRTVKEIEAKAQGNMNLGGRMMVRKIKNNGNKKEMLNNIAVENAALKESVKLAYGGVIKSILVHMQTWDLEDLVAVLLNARNQAVEQYKKGVDKDRNKEIIIALQRCAAWISEVWRNKQDNIHTIYCVEMETKEYLFYVERSGMPWTIDSTTLGMILQFESPNKALDLVDVSKDEFFKKHLDFMRASGLMNPLMHDDLEVIPVNSIVKKNQ